MSAFYNVSSSGTSLIIQNFYTLGTGSLANTAVSIALPSFTEGDTTVATDVTSVDVSVTDCDGNVLSTFTITEADWTSADTGLTVGGSGAGFYSQTLGSTDLTITTPTLAGMQLHTVTLTINYSTATTISMTDVHIGRVFTDIDDTCKCVIVKRAYSEEEYEWVAMYEALSYVQDCPGFTEGACNLVTFLNKICSDPTNCNC